MTAATNSCVIHGVSNSKDYSVMVTTVNPGKLPNLETAATQSPATQPPITTTTTQPVVTEMLQPNLASTGSDLEAPLMVGQSLQILGTLGVVFARRTLQHRGSRRVSRRSGSVTNYNLRKESSCEPGSAQKASTEARRVTRSAMCAFFFIIRVSKSS
jgi:hypothetical protein